MMPVHNKFCINFCTCQYNDLKAPGINVNTWEAIAIAADKDVWKHQVQKGAHTVQNQTDVASWGETTPTEGPATSKETYLNLHLRPLQPSEGLSLPHRAPQSQQMPFPDRHPGHNSIILWD